MKKILLIGLLLLFFVTGCGDTVEKQKEDELNTILEKNNYIVLDVRTNEEYETGHVVGSINIPYDEINEEVELDKEKTILVYCRSGKRSGIAYDTLTELGYTVFDLGAYESVTLEKTEEN